MADNDDLRPPGELLVYQGQGLDAPIQVRLEGETVWLSQKLLAELYGTTVPNINQHIAAIFEDEELAPEATIKKYLIVQTEGNRQGKRLIDHYNLDMILAVGFRVRSRRGSQFRKWATERISEYLVNGFTLDDERLKGKDREIGLGPRGTRLTKPALIMARNRPPVQYSVDHATVSRA
jgi:hypothetical protein